MSGARPVERVRTRLDNVRPVGNGWVTRCPGHGDRENSLSVADGEDGRVLVKCVRGSAFEEIVAALKPEPPDLFDREERGEGAAR